MDLLAKLIECFIAQKFPAFLVEPLPIFQGVLMLPQGWLHAVAE